MTRENGHTEAPARPAEPSAAEASRALAQRIARADVVAQGTVPFRSGPERRPPAPPLPQAAADRPRRRAGRRAVAVVVAMLAARIRGQPAVAIRRRAAAGSRTRMPPSRRVSVRPGAVRGRHRPAWSPIAASRRASSHGVTRSSSRRRVGRALTQPTCASRTAAPPLVGQRASPILNASSPRSPTSSSTPSAPVSRFQARIALRYEGIAACASVSAAQISTTRLATLSAFSQRPPARRRSRDPSSPRRSAPGSRCPSPEAGRRPR